MRLGVNSQRPPLPRSQPSLRGGTTEILMALGIRRRAEDSAALPASRCVRVSRPFGTSHFRTANSTLKGWAILEPSLRDEDEILAAFARPGASNTRHVTDSRFFRACRLLGRCCPRGRGHSVETSRGQARRAAREAADEFGRDDFHVVPCRPKSPAIMVPFRARRGGTRPYGYGKRFMVQLPQEPARREAVDHGGRSR